MNLLRSKTIETRKLFFAKTSEIMKESPYTFYDEVLTFSKYGLTKKAYFNNENNRI